MNDDGTYISAITLDSTFRKQSCNSCNNLIPIRCHDRPNQEKTQSGIVKKKAYIKLALRIKELQEKVRLAKMIEAIDSPSRGENVNGTSLNRLVGGNVRSDALTRSRAPSQESFLADANNSFLSSWSQETSKTFSSSGQDIIVNTSQSKSCFPIEGEDSSGRGGQCSVSCIGKEYSKAFARNTKNIRRSSQSYRPTNHNSRLVTIDDETDEENDELQDAKIKHQQQQSAVQDYRSMRTKRCLIHKRSQFLDRENTLETKNDGLIIFRSTPSGIVWDHKSCHSHDSQRGDQSLSSTSTNHLSRRSVDSVLDKKLGIQGENSCTVGQADIENSSYSSLRTSRSSPSHWSPIRNIDDSMITFHQAVVGDAKDSLTCFREVGEKKLDWNSSSPRNMDKHSKSIESNKSASSLPMNEVAEENLAFNGNKDVFDISVPDFYERDLDKNSSHSQRSVRSAFSDVKSMKSSIALPGKNCKSCIDVGGYGVFEVELATCYPAGDGNSTYLGGSRRSESSVSNYQTTRNSNRRDLSPMTTEKSDRIHSPDGLNDEVFTVHDASSNSVNSSIDIIIEDSLHSKPSEINRSILTHNKSRSPDFRVDDSNEDVGKLEVGFPSYDSEEEAENIDRRYFRSANRYTRINKISMIQDRITDDDDEESEVGFPTDRGDLLVGFPSKPYD